MRRLGRRQWWKHLSTVLISVLGASVAFRAARGQASQSLIFSAQQPAEQKDTASAEAAPGNDSPSEESPQSQNVRPRVREGTVLPETAGVIRQTGDRYSFFATSGTLRLVVLENLALERLLLAQQTYPGTVIWQIRGVMTEFKGQNYLLIERGILHRVEATPPVSGQ